jgi:DNA-binding NtrC family response regulator
MRYPHFVGDSPAMLRVYDTIEHVAETDVTVFVTGESGTGKELVAQAVHDLSARKRGPFVALHCGSIPRDLLESELFGHEAGATGNGEYVGALEQADGGTLFLDEICEMDPRLQTKMLHFLQDPEFRRVGGSERLRVDVRIVATTNRDPYDEIRKGRLRDDLYYRLHVVPVHMPPLRERNGDLRVLARHFLEGFAAKYGKPFDGFSDEALAVLGDGPRVTLEQLPEDVLDPPAAAGAPASASNGSDVILPFTEVEKREIARALRICDWNVAAAAQRLQLGQATVYRKIKKYGIPLARRSRETVPR